MNASEEPRDLSEFDANKPSNGEAATKSRKIPRSAAILFPISLGLLGGLWVFRIPIGESLVKGVLSTKGIENEIKLDELGFNGAKIRHLALKRKNETTLAAENAVLKWHIADGFAPHLDFLSAQSLNLNLAYNEKGMDFGALSEFLKPSDKKSNLKIRDLNIDNLRLNLKTQLGEIKANGNLKGTMDKGIKGHLSLNLPEKIADKNHNIDYFYSIAPMIEGRSLIIGNNLLIKNLNPRKEISNNIDLRNIDGNLVFAFIAPKNNSQSAKIQFLKSNLSAQNIEEKAFRLRASEIFLQNGWLNLGQNPKTDIVFDLKGSTKIGSISALGNIANNIDLDFLTARAKAGNLRIEINSKFSDLKSAIQAKSAAIGGFIDVIAPNLGEIANASFDGNLNIDISHLNGSSLDNLKNSLSGTGFETLLESPNLKGKFAISSDGKLLSIQPLQRIAISNVNSNLNLDLSQASGAFIPLEKDGRMRFFLNGNVSVKSDDSIGLNANLNTIEFKNNSLLAKLTGIEARNFSLAGYNFNLGSAIGEIRTSGNDIAKATFRGNLTSNDKNLKLAAKFDASITNNVANFALNGNSSNFAIGNVKGKNSKFNIKGRGNINTRIDANGNIDLGEVTTNGLVANNSHTDFGISFNPSKLSGNLNSDINIGHLSSDVIDLNNGKIKANGTIDLKGATKFNGIMNANVAKMRIEDNSILNAQINGPLGIVQNKDYFAIVSPSCLSLDFDEYIANGLALTSSKASLCPDNQNRIFAIKGSKTDLYANTKFDSANLMLGKGDDATRVILNDFKGQFVPSPGNNISFAGKSNSLELQFKTAPQNLASIISNDAQFSLINTSEGTKINALLHGLSSKGLPVLIQGSANAILNSKENGLTGTFDIENLSVSDSEKIKRFEDILVTGQGELNNNKVTIFGDAALKEKSINFAQIFFNHDLNTQSGAVLIDAPALEFGKPLIGYNNQVLQAKDIVPAISSLFGRSYGEIGASAKFEWAPNQKLISNANISAADLDFESTWGGIFGINGEIVIDDLLNLKTATSQNLKIGTFEVGVPIENGEIGFTLNGINKVTIDKAEWPFADGVLSLVPTDIEYGNPDLKFALKVQSIDMAKLLRLTKVPNLEIEGKMSGTLPVYLVDNGFEIRGGVLKADAGGVLRYTGPSPVAEKPKAQGIAKLKNKLFGEPPPPPAEMAFKALRDLRYKILEMHIDGRTTGDATLSILLEGSNPDLIGGHGFRFNISIKLPLNSVVKFYDTLKKSPSQFLDYNEPQN